MTHLLAHFSVKNLNKIMMLAGVLIGIGCTMTKDTPLVGLSSKKQSEEPEQPIDQKAVAKHCANYPHHKVIDWDYLAKIDYQKLADDTEQRYFKLTDEEKTFVNGTTYRKLQVAPDGTCFIRASNLAALDRLSFTKDQVATEQVINRLMAIAPYRKASLGAPDFKKISQLFRDLALSADVATLLTKLNHPCVDLTLDWLIRDLSWAIENRPYALAMAELKALGVELPADDFDAIENFQATLPQPAVNEIEEIRKKRTYAQQALSWLTSRMAQDDALKHHSYGHAGGNLLSLVKVWDEVFTDIIYQIDLDEGQKHRPDLIAATGNISSHGNKNHNDIAIHETRTLLISSSHAHSDALVRSDLLER